MNDIKDRGSFTIEATLSLTLFMCAFLCIVSLATIVKVETTTQHAINQVAKEIAQYYYVLEELGLANSTMSDEESADFKAMDDAVQSIVNFASVSNDVASNVEGEGIFTYLSNYQNIGSDFNDISVAAEGVYDSLGTVLEDPIGILKTLATSFAYDTITKIIAQPICKALIPKYITSSGDADSSLEKMGVIDGIDGLDFRMSSLLSDNRTVNIVVVYEVKIKGFGFLDETLLIKQTASTAAWVTGTTLKAANEKVSLWSKSSFDRGKEFVDIIKNETPSKAVADGVGIDLYSQDSNTFTSVVSKNVFSASYSEYTKNVSNSNSALNYTLDESAIKSAIKQDAKKLKSSMDKIDDTIKLEDGTECQTAREDIQHRTAQLVVVVPAEAGNDSSKLEVLNRIAKEIETETGVKVSITYRDFALEAG